MGAIVTARSGFYADYPRLQASAEAERSPLGYYAAAAAKGEPAGRWFGGALAELGLSEGQAVDMLELGPDQGEEGRSAYRAVYSQVNPATGEYLGRRPMTKGKQQEQRWNELLEAEPHATQQRRRDLGLRASREARESAPYTDVTVSWSKSIPVFHASIRQNERLAREAGDLAAAAHWAEQERKFQQVLQDANTAMLRHAQRWAGTVRTGYHGAKVNGEETGKWEDARIVVTSWLQGTNRDMDPHDHEHNLFARMALTASDGKWRALDTMALRRQLPAMQAVAAAHAEAGLTREFGVAWEKRADGAGNEIRGVTQAHMDLFSARAQEVDARLAQMAREFEAKYERKPSRREVLAMHADAWDATRAPKEDAAIDWDRLSREWDEKTGGALAGIAPAVAGQAEREAAVPDEAQLGRVARRALARVQAAHATWTRAELQKYVQLTMPTSTRAMDPDALVALQDRLTDRALAGEFEAVVPLAAPQWPVMPDHMIRDLDGCSVYMRPGSERFATRAQLSMEEEMLLSAQRTTTLRLSREMAAQAVGADADALDAALREKAQEAREDATRSGLRLDQAAAVYYVLTSPRVGEVLVGPAGSGKTRSVAQASKAWLESGRPVMGLATSQAAVNVLLGAGVPQALNTSAFLGHLPGQRGALGITELKPRTLIVIDEASMMSTADLRDILGYAARRSCKVIICGDHAQLEAVESGGGLGLLASLGGYVRLGEAVRFREAWEGPASLRLREGDASVLAEYDDHGRIRGGTPEDVMADARQLYVSHYVQGRDVRLITASRELGREMARDIRSDLRHLGLVDTEGPEVAIGGGQRAARGDLLRVTVNDRRAGVTNRDILRVESVNDDGTLTVRRAGERDGATGERTWTDDVFRWKGYRAAELAYWSTAHAAQGETVTVGVAVITGSEDAHWLYSAMTRGAQENIACTMTTPSVADPKPGARPDPELDRRERVLAERAGEDAQSREPARAEGAPEPRDPVAVLADVAARTERKLSALEYQRQELSDAHHLARLAAQWDGETRGLRQGAYRRALQAELPAELRPALNQDGGTATWLWRTMRAAEAAGQNPREVARAALRGRSLEGADNLPAVIDARIRRAGPMIPTRIRPWAEQVPETADLGKQRYLRELAAAMDERKAAIGEHAAEAEAGWAVAALGPVPPDGLDRLEWESRASHIGAYREMYGWDHPGDPVGMEPSGDTPEKRAAWHASYAAMTRTDGIDLSADSDIRLHMIRDTYAAETAWAPEYPADRLRGLRTMAINAEATAARADAEAAAARTRSEAEAAQEHEGRAAASRMLRDWYRTRAEADAEVLEDYKAWARLTEGSRRLAVLADQELRRRYPDAGMPELVSHEPEAPDAELPAMPKDEAELAELAAEADRKRAAFRERLEERQGVRVPDEDPDYEVGEEAWPPPFGGRDRDAILHPPPPLLGPSAEVLRMAAARDADREAVS